MVRVAPHHVAVVNLPLSLVGYDPNLGYLPLDAVAAGITTRVGCMGGICIQYKCHVWYLESNQQMMCG